MRSTRYIVAPVLPEMFYMLHARVNYKSAQHMFNLVRDGAFQIVDLVPSDMSRMDEIMGRYQFDYVDTAILSVAERLDIDEIYTFDRRDFGVFVPRHRAYLTVLP